MEFVLFCLSCITLFILIYGGFVPPRDEIAFLYIAIVLNTFIIVFIMGGLCYG